MIEFTLRDAIYIGINVSSVLGLLIGLKFRIQRTEASNKTLNNIIFQEKGGLNVVTNEVCKSHRDQIHNSIRREAGVTNEAFRQISCLNQNIIKMMVHMNLEPIVIEHKTQGEIE